MNAPEDTIETFDLDAYVVEKNRVKQVLLGMNKSNNCLDLFGKTANNLYTLWALITLNKSNIPASNIFAERYLAFMQEVQGFIDAQTPDETIPTPETVNQFTYYLNSKGAATEPPQREKRLIALSSIL